MRLHARAVSVSWIPSESLSGLVRMGIDMRMLHYDPPPPDTLPDHDAVLRLRDEDLVRFANVISAWIDVEDGRVVGAGRTEESGLVIGSTTLRIAGLGVTFRAVGLPDLKPAPDRLADGVRFVQTSGGRTGAPFPRPIRRAPYVQWNAPVVWTTLALTLRADGSSSVELLGASPFPRHWVYGVAGALMLKSGHTDLDRWMNECTPSGSPWADRESPTAVTAVESALERQLARSIMQAGSRPRVVRAPAGSLISQQGDPGNELYLLLDGILDVAVDGRTVAEVGPGAIVGERALLENGRRTASLIARTPVRLAVADRQLVDLDRLRELSSDHRREDRALES